MQNRIAIPLQNAKNYEKFKFLPRAYDAFRFSH